MKGSRILVTGEPKGVFMEGYLTTSLTPKPGIIVNMLSTAPVGGRFYWEPYGETGASGNNGVAADGDRRLMAVLLPDELQGRNYDTAYATGDRIFMYCPLPGEEMNVIFQNISGTGSDQDLGVGDQLMVDDGTGKLLVADNNAESEPFISLEAKVDVAADYVLHVLFTGY